MPVHATRPDADGGREAGVIRRPEQQAREDQAKPNRPRVSARATRFVTYGSRRARTE